MPAILGCLSTSAQTTIKPVKISHAEPIFQDLVRDLGARKGEKEFNLGANFSDAKNYRENAYLAEYEFAPVNRLGLEVETDFSFFSPKKNTAKENIPGNRLDEIKLSAQYTFFVSEKAQTSIAIGYAQAFEFNEFHQYGEGKLITGLVYSPFFVAAKKWGSNIHTIVYSYPMIHQQLGETATTVDWQVNSSVMYALPNSKHFIGIEVNQEINHEKLSVTYRPQVKIKLDSHYAIGMAAGIPRNSDQKSVSAFFRLIYEL